MKTYCIEINGLPYKMSIVSSDMDGFYKYELTPLNTNTHKDVIYIMPDRKGYLFNGKNLDSRNVLYFHIY